ncbi:sensor histidine kinase [Nocardioides sp. Soil796]|uniref:sensor histidine kinase n=1 Tax=Nocardioides sp. Soil796 TaxID=1736412 RepID=UPI000709EC2D|nr:ATP-binding protein [Nocardioides sp. Soil796]KRF19913.1 hypothetical protein ASH02_23045 [Nocardioides sp. Soil796]
MWCARLAWIPERADLHHEVEAKLWASFAEHATLALQVARARSDQQRRVVFDGRDRIGRDLHDVVIQRLFAVAPDAPGRGPARGPPGVAQRLETSVDELDATIKEIRRTIFALGSLEATSDIKAEVTRIVDRAAGTLKFRLALRFDGPSGPWFSDDVAPHLLAVLGEALSNASRHAEASAVDLELSAGEQVQLRISDDGRGLPEDIQESGLNNMRRRAGGPLNRSRTYLRNAQLVS